MSNLTLPGNPRYQPANLQEYFGYDNLFRAVAEVEIATLKTLADIGFVPQYDIALLTLDLERELLAITTTEVDKVEREMTNHDIRAWVQIAQRKLLPDLSRWIHVPLTSFDPLDTARILQFIRAHLEVVKPLTDKVVRFLSQKTRTFASQRQIGRTHGQHALPITVGFWLATVLNRVLMNITSANEAAERLTGKISGAVGAYNAQVALGITKLCGTMSFEERVLKRLGLKPARISTQILPMEPLADYLFSCLKLSASFAQFGRDARHLMRTEIGELCEPFESGQVGSSTMAHKRNPINFENLEGTWLKTKNEFGKVLDNMVSDHQRDLVGSTVMRDFPTIVVNLVLQLNTLLRKSKSNPLPFIARIAVDAEACERNLAIQGDSILAEPMYITLQMVGYTSDAHDLISHHALPLAKERGIALFDAVTELLEDRAPAILGAWKNLPQETQHLLRSPKEYIGSAGEQALKIADAADLYLAPKKA